MTDPDDTPQEPMYVCQITQLHDWAHEISTLEICGHVRYECKCGEVSYSHNHLDECQQTRVNA